MANGEPSTHGDSVLLLGPQAATAITGLRHQWLHYHNHKEQMVYVAAGLYIGAAATVATRSELAQQLRTSFWPAVLLVALAFLFVGWQLNRRRVATVALEACNRQLVGLHPPSELAAVVQPTGRQGFGRLVVSELLTFSVMALFTYFAWRAI